MEKEKFNLQSIERTFTKYKPNTIVDGIVVLKRDDGVVFNIGGKSDAFIEKEDFQDYSLVKVGDRFKAQIIKLKNDENMIVCSKNSADIIIQDTLNAEKLRLGSVFSFFVTSTKRDGAYSKMGTYNIFVPQNELIRQDNIKSYNNKQIRGIVTEINQEEKLLIVSEKVIYEQEKSIAENNFWKAIFINKVVEGRVEKVLPYGAFIDVAGVTCFIHISDVSYEKIDNINEKLKVDDLLKFRVIKIDRENKKVNLGIKQLYDNPKLATLKNMTVGQILNGQVIKILQFGALVKCENNVVGLLSIANATTENNKKIYEIVKLDENIKVEVLNINLEEEKLNLKLIK